MKVAILLLAAGRGTRFGGALPKAYLQLAGKPLLLHAAERLSRVVDLAAGHQMVVVAHPDDQQTWLQPLLPALQRLGAVRIAAGGANRQESMRNGLAAVDEDVDVVMVHDAARPLVPVEASRACLGALTEADACLLALPVADTLKRVADGQVAATVDRSGLWQAQTPQAVRRKVLERALAQAATDGFQGTDDVSLVEHCGGTVAVVQGQPTNLKITQPADLPLAAAILAAELA